MVHPLSEQLNWRLCSIHLQRWHVEIINKHHILLAQRGTKDTFAPVEEKLTIVLKLFVWLQNVCRNSGIFECRIKQGRHGNEAMTLSSLIPKPLSDSIFQLCTVFLDGFEIKSGSGCEYHSSPSLPLVQFGVNDVLGLVGTGASGERDEVRQVVWRHALEQLVCCGESFTRASGTHTQHLGEEGGEGGKGKKEEGRKVSPSHVPNATTAKKKGTLEIRYV